MNQVVHENAPPTEREIIDNQNDRLAIHTHRIYLTQQNLPYAAVAGKRLPSKQHFAVYADQIILDESLQNPGRNIELYAREVVIAKPLTLDVAGADADKDFQPGDLPTQTDVTPGTAGTAGANGTRGGDGGEIIICAQRMVNQIDASTQLSFTDIAAIGPQLFAQAAKVANTIAIEGFEIGRMKLPGNQSMAINLEQAQLEGQSEIQMLSSGLDATRGRISLRFLLPKLTLTGITRMTGAHRISSTTFACQIVVTARTRQAAASGEVEWAASLRLDGPVNISVPMVGETSVSAARLEKITHQLAESLEGRLFEPLLTSFNSQLQSATLQLLANGGIGGRGQDGHPGVRGEPGADGVQPKRPGVCAQGGCGFPEEAYGKNGHAGGRAGDAGHSGNGGDSGSIHINVIEPPQLVLFFNTAGGDGGASASPGDRGRGGRGGKGAMSKMVDSQGRTLDDMQAPNGNEGPQGAAAAFNGNTGATGQSGLPLQMNGRPFNTQPMASYAAAELAQSLSLSQLLITQNAIDLGFLNAAMDTDRLTEVAAAYNWLIEINQPFTDTTITIDSQRVPLTDQAVRGSMHNSAVVGLMRIQQGLDFFGNSYNWTPVLNLKSLITRTGEIISLGKVIEAQYRQYLNKDKTDRQRIDALRKAKQEIDQKLTNILTEIEKMRPQIDNFATEVNDYTEDLQRQRSVLLKDNLEFKDQLIEYLRKENGLKFDDFLDILGTVIGATGSVVGGLGGIKGAFDAFKKAEKFSNKIKNVVEIFKKAKATIDSINKAYKSVKKRIDESNPNAAKIIVDADDFDKLIDEYLGKFPAACELRAAMDFYLQLSQARNMAAYNYSALVSQQLNLQVQHDQLYHGIQLLNAELAQNQDNLLPIYTAYMKDAYEDVQRHLLKNIYQEARAYEYWALESRKLDTSNLNIAMQAITHERLVADIDTFRENNDSFSEFKQKLIISADDYANEFAALPDSRSLIFGLDIHDDLGFLNMRYIIARRFELAFPDIEGGKNVLYINLVHSGRAVMNNNSDLTAPGAVRVFSHRPRVKLYKIDYGDKDNTAGGNFGEGGQGYIGLSPFSNWRIDFDLKGNEWLDLTQIKTVVLTLAGRFLGPGRSLT
ncbi:MAG: hypothetical protein Tsb002_26920 [Wenzhouxiangellaceae bacterium]